jgi:hypothetical protein
MGSYLNIRDSILVRAIAPFDATASRPSKIDFARSPVASRFPSMSPAPANSIVEDFRARAVQGVIKFRKPRSTTWATIFLRLTSASGGPLQLIRGNHETFNRLALNESIETRSLPTLARCHPRSFTFYVADPSAPFTRCGRTTTPQAFSKSSVVSTSRSTRRLLTIPSRISGTSATVTRP